MATDLTDKAESVFSIQSYEKAPKIDGVVLQDLKAFGDDGGTFMELLRLSSGVAEQIPDFEVKQVNYSQVAPRVIKAFHLHKNQDDVWFVPPHEQVLVILSDQRKGSASENVTMRFMMGGLRPQLVYIPRGVAHGYTNLGRKTAALIYFVNQQFDMNNPDEGRLPWDFLGKEIWEVIKG